MEDDRVETNSDQGKISGLKILGGVGAGFAIIIIWLSFAPDKINPGVPGSGQRSSITDSENIIPVTPPESKVEYISSTKKMGGKKAPIYIKEFLKNPDKFKGIRLNFVGQIMNIEEKNNETYLQVFINQDYDVLSVYFPGTMDIYKDDFIMIYGEGAGVFSGKNLLGADISQPMIHAKYIVKRASNNE